MDPRLLTLRSKKIGVCLADTRLKARKSIDETAEYLGIPSQQYSAFEKGINAPSLPQLEQLSLFFDVPVEHLISWQTKPDAAKTIDPEVFAKIVKLREHVIAAYLSKSRQLKGFSPEAVAEGCGISVETLTAFEKAEKSIPYPVLEALSKFLDMDLSTLYSSHGPLAKKKTPVEAEEVEMKIGNLPPELEDFIKKPINRPYIELAQKLSVMKVDRLRAIAESLLEITY